MRDAEKKLEVMTPAERAYARQMHYMLTLLLTVASLLLFAITPTVAVPPATTTILAFLSRLTAREEEEALFVEGCTD